MITDTNLTSAASHEATAEHMQSVLEKQKASYLEEGAVKLATRIDRIDRALDLLVRYQDKLAEAINEDFCNRSIIQSKITDITASVASMKHAKKHVKKWMKPQKRTTMFPLGLLGARSRIEYQPLGVVGVISPWNFPVNLTFSPMASIFAAGNRVMIKPSEFTPNTSELMAKIFREAYSEEEVAVFTGDAGVGQSFGGLAFDHLIFTGATSIARHVMMAAAKNLVPLTLELGGKSPVIVGRSADIKQTTDRIMFGKTLNAGQICLAPDYLYVPEEKQQEIIEHCKTATEAMFPSLFENNDYTSIINERHYKRLMSYLEDAKAKGATLIEINSAQEDKEKQHTHYKIPPTLILNVRDDMKVMQEEIFGPLLPIKTYKDVKEAIHYINANDRPLGLYYFGSDPQEERMVLDRTTSGGVTLNDVIMHVTQEELPFGGIGPSGMGSYHGHHGFINFSHTKSIFKQSPRNIADLIGLKPPYGKKTLKAIKMQMKI